MVYFYFQPGMGPQETPTRQAENHEWRKIEKTMMTGGESKGAEVAGTAWSASGCPEGKLGSVAIHSPLLLSPVVLIVVVKRRRVPAFSKGGLQSPLPCGRSSLPSILHVTVPYEASPWSKFPLQWFCSLLTTLDFAHVEQWVRPQGMGEKEPCAPTACALHFLFLSGEAEGSKCLHR